MRFLSGKDLDGLLPAHALVEAIDHALRDFARQWVVVPPRLHTHHGDLTLLTMPVIGRSAFGAKVVSVVPSNAGRNLPVINGLMTLYDGATGVPVAVMNAAALTAQRTGAVGALGLKHITPPDIDSVGIVGVGVQGVWQAICACAVRPLKTVYFLARSDEKARHFVEAVSRHVPSVKLTRCADVDALLSRTTAVIAATTSPTPVLPDDQKRLEGKHFVSVGSYRGEMQELPDSIYKLAQQVVVDSAAAHCEVGDLIRPLAEGWIAAGDIVHLADLVSGNRAIDVNTTTVCKTVGLALYDLYVAQALCAEAQRLDRGTLLEL